MWMFMRDVYAELHVEEMFLKVVAAAAVCINVCINVYAEVYAAIVLGEVYAEVYAAVNC